MIGRRRPLENTGPAVWSPGEFACERAPCRRPVRPDSDHRVPWPGIVQWHPGAHPQRLVGRERHDGAESAIDDRVIAVRNDDESIARALGQRLDHSTNVVGAKWRVARPRHQENRRLGMDRIPRKRGPYGAPRRANAPKARPESCWTTTPGPPTSAGTVRGIAPIGNGKPHPARLGRAARPKAPPRAGDPVPHDKQAAARDGQEVPVRRNHLDAQQLRQLLGRRAAVGVGRAARSATKRTDAHRSGTHSLSRRASSGMSEM